MWGCCAPACPNSGGHSRKLGSGNGYRSFCLYSTHLLGCQAYLFLLLLKLHLLSDHLQLLWVHVSLQGAHLQVGEISA